MWTANGHTNYQRMYFQGMVYNVAKTRNGDRATYVFTLRTCNRCQVIYWPENKDQRYCSKRCRKVVKRQNNRKNQQAKEHRSGKEICESKEYYYSREEANRFVSPISRKLGVPLITYACTVCDGFHHTSDLRKFIP